MALLLWKGLEMLCFYSQAFGTVLEGCGPKHTSSSSHEVVSYMYVCSSGGDLAEALLP